MFTKVSLYDLQQNVFQEINKNWMLLSAGEMDGNFNTMTVSWGALGELWGRETATVYVRQSRYTKQFIDTRDYFTISMFDGHREELSVLGRISGRDCDKIKEVGFHPIALDGSVGFEESKCVLVCKKLYCDDIKLEDIPKAICDQFYADGDFHTMYIGAIVGCYVKEAEQK